MDQKLNSIDSWTQQLYKYVGGGTMKKMLFCGWQGQKDAAPIFFLEKALGYDLVESFVQ